MKGDVRECALVISSHMFGGGQRIVADLAGIGARMGNGPRVVLLGREMPQFDNVSPTVVGYDGQYDRLRSLAGTAWRLRRMLQGSNVRVIHTHGWDADVIGCLATVGLAMRQLVHLHVTPDWFESEAFRHRARRWLTGLALRSSGTYVVAVSDAVRRHWSSGINLDPDVIRVVRNGIDVVRYYPDERGKNALPPVIGVAARLAPMKGIEYLLDALGELAEDGVMFRLRVAGTGGLRKSLEERCLRLGISEQTEFLGHVQDMPAFYRTIDIYALPSVSTEGLPLGVLEAMASGIPVVATTVGGTPEAVRDGTDGLLVPPRDVGALTGALRRLLADPKARDAMGKGGRAQAVKAFALERFSDEIFELYRQMLDE